jgi:hypothetical protein
MKQKAEGQIGGEWHPRACFQRVEAPTNNQPASSPLKRSAIAESLVWTRNCEESSAPARVLRPTCVLAQETITGDQLWLEKEQ